MILILENGKMSLITNHKDRNNLSAGIDLNTVFLQEQGKYYFGNGEIQVIPDVPSVVSLERGDSITQHLTIEPNDVTTYFNELYLPPEFKREDLPFEFLRSIKDGYKLSNFHTRVWIFDKKLYKHFQLAAPSIFGNSNKSTLESYLELYKSFSNLSDVGIFSLGIDKLYENLDKFNGTNYDELNKWSVDIKPQTIKVVKISHKDLMMVQPLQPGIDPRSQSAKASFPEPLVVKPVEPPKPDQADDSKIAKPIPAKKAAKAAIVTK